MKYNIQIMSKQECTLFSTKDLTENYIIISINDTGCNEVIYDNEHIKGIYYSWFDDIEEIVKDLSLKRMTKGQAKAIKEFVDEYKSNTNNIIVHCTADISRSGAVGCVLARYLNGSDEYLLATGKYIPNKVEE